jgi:ElaB/YqjD/DUF883 family membrane-anchored ribosome-binding protein
MSIEDQMKVKTIKIKERFVSAQDQAAHKIHDLETKAALIGSRAQVSLLKATGRTREVIHRRPLTSVLAGIGAGCLLGGLAGLIVGRNSTTKTTHARSKSHSRPL